jgi:glycosyltransferase involved in cell wall biosynthesis
MIANFNPVKNIFLYLKIAKLLLAQRKYKFFILGQVWQTQMDYYQKCINFIKNNNITNIKIFNQIRSDIFLSDIDLYVCTSHKESSPLSIWEALSAKMPVVTTNVGDVHDLNKSNKYFAKIIYSNDEKEFAASIVNLSNNLHEYKLKSEASIKCFYKNFTIKEYSEKFEKIINL